MFVAWSLRRGASGADDRRDGILHSRGRIASLVDFGRLQWGFTGARRQQRQLSNAESPALASDIWSWGWGFCVVCDILEGDGTLQLLAGEYAMIPQSDKYLNV